MKPSGEFNQSWNASSLIPIAAWAWATKMFLKIGFLWISGVYTKFPYLLDNISLAVPKSTPNLWEWVLGNLEISNGVLGSIGEVDTGVFTLEECIVITWPVEALEEEAMGFSSHSFILLYRTPWLEVNEATSDASELGCLPGYYIGEGNTSEGVVIEPKCCSLDIESGLDGKEVIH